MNENTDRTANLNPPWKKGESGNPEGRPVGAKHGLRARLNAVMRKTPNADILKVLAAKGIELEEKDNAAVIAEVVNREAQKGNMSAIKFIGDMTESKMPTDLNIGGVEGGEPIKVLNIVGVIAEPEEFDEPIGIN
jgi:hypothetical protein